MGRIKLLPFQLIPPMCYLSGFPQSLVSPRWLCALMATSLSSCMLPAREPAAAAPSTDRPAPAMASALPHSLSLADARRIAYQRNWDLLAAQANVDQTIALELVSREFPNPTFSYTTGKISSDASPNGTRRGNSLWNRSYDSVFAVNQLIEIGGKRGLRQSSASHGRLAASASLQDARRILDLGVTKAYLAALLAEANVAILSNSAASLRQQAKIAGARLNAGDISQSDKAQIEIAAEQLELNAEAAKSTALTARIAMEVLLGEKSPKGTWQASDNLESLATDSFAAPEATAQLRPDVLAAEANLRKAEADHDLQKAMRIPDPTALLQYEHNPPDTANTIGIGRSFPLPLWNSNKGNIKAAAAAHALAADQLGKIKAQAAAEVAAARAALEEASARRKRYANTIAPKSAETVKIVQYAYQKGGAALVDLLQAQRTDNDIRVATAQAMADKASAAATLANVLNLHHP